MRDMLLQNPVFSMAAEQVDRVAELLDLTEDLRERCKGPKRIITVTVPIVALATMIMSIVTAA